MGPAGPSLPHLSTTCCWPLSLGVPRSLTLSQLLLCRVFRTPKLHLDL